MTAHTYPEIPDEGIDVTHLLGEARDHDVDLALVELSAALEANGLRPCVTTARRLVTAYDRFLAITGERPA